MLGGACVASNDGRLNFDFRRTLTTTMSCIGYEPHHTYCEETDSDYQEYGCIHGKQPCHTLNLGNQSCTDSSESFSVLRIRHFRRVFAESLHLADCARWHCNELGRVPCDTE